jgi:hypothetical protein
MILNILKSMLTKDKLFDTIISEIENLRIAFDNAERKEGFTWLSV